MKKSQMYHQNPTQNLIQMKERDRQSDINRLLYQINPNYTHLHLITIEGLLNLI